MIDLTTACVSRRVASAALLFWLASVSTIRATAQSVDRPSEDAKLVVRVASGDAALWLARLDTDHAELFHTTPSSAFDFDHALDRRPRSLTTIEDDLFLAFPDGTFYRYSPQDDKLRAERSLTRPPLSLCSGSDRIFALVTADVGAALPGAAAKLDPAGPALVVATYDGSAWSASASCPPGATENSVEALAPRLLVYRDEMLLFWSSHLDSSSQIHLAHRALSGGPWSAIGTIGAAGLDGFWPVLVDGVPILVVAQAKTDQPPRITAYRHLGALSETLAVSWKRSELALSPPPAESHADHVEAAFGYNQHVGLLLSDQSGRYVIRFARPAETATLPSIDVNAALTRTRVVESQQNQAYVLIQVLFVVVLVSLFVWRRESMVTQLNLPPQWALALGVQRLLGFLIDFLPFALAASIAVDVPLRASFQELFGGWWTSLWSVGADAAATLDPRTRLWWTLTCVGHVVYCATMERLLGRSVGKLFAGVRVRSEDGERAATWQILTRNGLKLLELVPQFWIFALLVPLSRNRQRLGDIFAKTVVVRHAIRGDHDTGTDSGKDADSASVESDEHNSESADD